jgi:antitoxin YefM
VDKFKINYYTCAIKRTSLEHIMRIVNFSEARNNLKTVLNQVADDADYTIITRRDSGDAVVMSLETFNSFMETFHLLKSPANAAHLTKSIQQFKNGKVQGRDIVDG